MCCIRYGESCLQRQKTRIVGSNFPSNSRTFQFRGSYRLLGDASSCGDEGTDCDRENISTDVTAWLPMVPHELYLQWTPLSSSRVSQHWSL